MPKSLQRWVTSLSVSSNVPSSSRNSIRSRAVILPSLCSRARRSSPPPASARASRRFSSARICSRFIRLLRHQEGPKYPRIICCRSEVRGGRKNNRRTEDRVNRRTTETTEDQRNRRTELSSLREIRFGFSQRTKNELRTGNGQLGAV